MARKLPPITVHPSQGGRLLSALPDEAGGLNYVEKVNWRRFSDREILREGDEPFVPNSGMPASPQSLPGGGAIDGIWELDRPNGDRAIVVATRTALFRFNYGLGGWVSIGTGFSASGQKWRAESMDGYLILNNGVDLPVTYRVEDSAVSPIYEMREIGISAVAVIVVYNGFLLCADVTEIQSGSLTAWMNGGTPYGVVPSNLTNRIRYKIVWSDYAKPRSWAPLITGTIEAATKNVITLVYPVTAFPVGSKLAVIGAGPSGGTLGGQVGIDDGVPVTAVAGAVITISTPANSSLTFPLTVKVVRFADTSSFVGSSSIQDDSSPIILMKKLDTSLLVYRETSVFVGRYTAVVATPFVFRDTYHGRNVPFYPDTVEELPGNKHVYATENRFYTIDSTGDPELQPVLDGARDLFFANLSSANADTAFAKINEVTREVFFFCPSGVLAYDYEGKTVSFIDETYSAAAYVRKPKATVVTGPSEFWFLLAKSGQVLRYGLDSFDNAIYTRRGATYEAVLKSGISPVNDVYDEKDLIAYVPHFVFPGTVVPVDISMFGCDNVAQTPELLYTETLTNADDQNLSCAFFRNIYFQDEIRVTSASPVELTARTWRFNLQNTQSVTRKQ